MINASFPVRKPTSLPKFDYNTPGYYFLTICTEDRKKLLCSIVGGGLLDAPKCHLTHYGNIADEQLGQMANFYGHVQLIKYVVMPNHIHLLLHVTKEHPASEIRANNAISQFVGTFKRFCNRKIGQDIWQSTFHDHVVRNEQDYLRIWEYIDTNPARWQKDCFFIP